MSHMFMNPDTWERVYRAQHTPPPTDQDALIDWIHFQHIPSTYDSAVSTAISALRRKHRGTSARSLAISAPEDLGKSAAVMSGILDEVFDANGPGWFAPHPTTHRAHIPWVYVNAMTSSSSVSVLREVADFCGFGTVKNEDEARKRLSRLMPLHGVRGVIVDEASTLRRASATSSRLPDGLRGLQHLPVPFVFVGIDLESSALLRDFGKPNDSVRQVRLRTDVLPLSPLNGHSGALEWGRLIGGFGRRLRLIDGFDVDGLKTPGLARRLAAITGARPGVLFEILKNAAAEAVEGDTRRLTEDLILGNVTCAQEAA